MKEVEEGRFFNEDSNLSSMSSRKSERRPDMKENKEPEDFQRYTGCRYLARNTSASRSGSLPSLSDSVFNFPYDKTPFTQEPSLLSGSSRHVVWLDHMVDHLPEPRADRFPDCSSCRGAFELPTSKLPSVTSVLSHYVGPSVVGLSASTRTVRSLAPCTLPAGGARERACASVSSDSGSADGFVPPGGWEASGMYRTVWPGKAANT